MATLASVRGSRRMQPRCKYFRRHTSSATDSRLGCFHQQETQQRVALLANMPQPLTIGAGVFTRNESQVAANLLAASETLR